MKREFVRMYEGRAKKKPELAQALGKSEKLLLLLSGSYGFFQTFTWFEFGYV